MRTIPFRPIFSHGGYAVPGYAIVTGDDTNSGRPMGVAGCHPLFWPSLIIKCTGGTATVLVEGNGGELGSDGYPDSAQWFDVSGGGYSMTAGEFKAKSVNPAVPWYRTRITARSGSTVESYIAYLLSLSGQPFGGSYPTLMNSLPYSP